MLMVDEIKKEFKNGLLGIHADSWEDRVSLHYNDSNFRELFPIYTISKREPEDSIYPYEAVAHLEDGTKVFCILRQAEKEKWEAAQ